MYDYHLKAKIIEAEKLNESCVPNELEIKDLIDGSLTQIIVKKDEGKIGLNRNLHKYRK